jgi:hypothetical protein
MCPISTLVADDAIAAMLWCSGEPDTPVARPLSDLGERDARCEAFASRPVGRDRSEVEDGKWNRHVAPILSAAGLISRRGYVPTSTRSRRREL